jgi:tape measure domain-containing protein
MTETADFALRLKDQVSKDAATAAGGMAKVAASFNHAKRAADAFDPNKHWRGQRSQLDRVAKAQDEIHLGMRRRQADDAKNADRAARMFARHSEAKLKRQRKEQEAADAFRSERRLEAQGFGGANLLGLGPAVAAATALATAGLAAAYAVGRIAYEFSAATIGAAAFAQNSKLALGALMRDAGMAATQFREVRFEAQALGLDVMGTVDQFRKLISAQFDVGTAREIVRMSADLKIAGANVEKAILAISQIKMKGFLQGEELTGQLAEAGVSAELVYKRLEKQLGKTRKEVLTMQKTGKIQADVAIEAIFGAVKDKTGVEKFGDLARKNAEEGLTGMAGKSAAALANFFISAGEAVTPIITPIFKRITGLFESLLANRKLALFGERALEALQRFGAWTDENWPRIENFIVGGFEAAVAGAGQLFDAGEYLVENWDTIATAFEGGVFWLQALGVSALLVAAPFIAISALAYGAAFGIAWLTGKMIESREEMAKWLKVAGVVLSLTGVGAAVGAPMIMAGYAIAPDDGAAAAPPQMQSQLASPRVSPDNMQTAMGRTVNAGGINITNNVAGIDIGGDPESAGAALGEQMNRALNNWVQNLEA